MCAINNNLSDIADSYGDKNIKIGKNQFFVQTVDFLRNEIVGGQKKAKFDGKFKNIQIVAPYKEVGRGKNWQFLSFEIPVNISRRISTLASRRSIRQQTNQLVSHARWTLRDSKASQPNV